MTKAELIEKLSERTDYTKKVTNELFTQLITIMEEELEAGHDITITGLGTFKVSHRKARQGRNPSTGEAIQIKASNNVSFKAVKSLKEKLNK